MRRWTAISTLALLVLCCLLTSSHSGELPTAKPEEVGVSSQGLDRLDAYIERIVDDKQFSGVVVMMARHGKVVHRKSFGLMELETKKPMCAEAIFRIASMTKPITSVAVMMLCDEGRLALDDPVSKYIPEFKNPRVLVSRQPLKTVPAKREITIRDLLRHTSGLTYAWNPELGPLYRQAGIIYGLTPEKVTLEENVKRLAKMPLLFSPGEKWEYGLSTDVLGRVVEVVSGISLDEFFQTRIFAPLSMNDTHFRLPEEKNSRLPAVYMRDDNGQMRRLFDGKMYLEPLPYSVDFAYNGKSTYLSGGAGLCSTASDYMRFCQMLLNGGQLNGKRLLREETVRAMRSNQIGDLSGLDLGPGEKFGLGFQVVENVEQKDQQLVGSYSWGGFFGTLFWIVPKEDWILVVMLQQVGGPERTRRWPAELERFAAAAVVK